MFSSEFREIFKNTFFAKYLQASAICDYYLEKAEKDKHYFDNQFWEINVPYLCAS